MRDEKKRNAPQIRWESSRTGQRETVNVPLPRDARILFYTGERVWRLREKSLNNTAKGRGIYLFFVSRASNEETGGLWEMKIDDWQWFWVMLREDVLSSWVLVNTGSEEVEWFWRDAWRENGNFVDYLLIDLFISTKEEKLFNVCIT